MTMDMFVAGRWTSSTASQPVVNPFDGTVIDTVPKGQPADIARAVTTLVVLHLPT
jgi:acyl-CoA reductase-like NAD-dependent aldehyde dehydrogenase